MKCNSECYYYSDVKEGLFCTLYKIVLTDKKLEDDCSKYISEKDFKIKGDWK